MATGVLAAGVPATVKKRLSGSSWNWTEYAADDYQQRRRLHLTASVAGSTDGVAARPALKD